MSSYQNGDWHNVNGGGLPFRPPTVDEALPYSPFTSVVPFSPDIIPFPTAEPPTPPTTLSSDQQSAAKKAVGILNDEIKGPASTAQHLENTLRELRNLLGNPHEMTEYRFKPTGQLATPPPDSPNLQSNGTTPTKAPTLSPFASMLLKHTDVHYLPAGARTPQKPRPKPEPPRHTISESPARMPPQPVTPGSNRAFHEQNGALRYSHSTPVSSARSVAPRSGPAVVVKPLGPNAIKDEYRRYDHLPAGDSQAQRKRPENGLLALRPQDREIAEQKIDYLHKFVEKLSREKDDADESEFFSKVSCLESDIMVLRNSTLDRLYDRIMALCATNCFSFVPVDVVLQIQSLSEPSITASDQSSLFGQAELDSWADDLKLVESGLKASKLVLATMLEGCEDRRITPEDLVVAILEVMKRVLQLCIFPVLGSRRSGESSDLFACAMSHREKMLTVIRLCTSVIQSLAKLIVKVSLADNALNPVEYLALDLLVRQNSDSEKDSVFGIQAFERLRQAAMEVLTQMFASHPDHQLFIITEILNNLEKLPDKGTNARQFKSPHDPPIMSVSALFMRFVQVAATNQPNRHKKVTARTEPDKSADDEESDYEPDNPHKSVAKSRPKGNASARTTAQRLVEDAKSIASRIASHLTERALNVSKSGDKPFRNLLDMFVEDFCNVLGSPEWPAATTLLLLLFTRMHTLLSQSNKDMALAIMGTMGCGIIDFKLRVKRLKRDVDTSQSELSSKLDHLAEDALDNGIQKKDLLGFKGPYRMVIESLPDYLKVAANQDDPHLQSVRGSYVTFWLDSVNQAVKTTEDSVSLDQALSDLQPRLETMLLDPRWLSREYKFQDVSETQSQLAAGILTLQQTFCQYFSAIVHTMLKFTQENAATLKSRAIKNIESFVNKDSQAIPEKLVMGVINLLRDTSPLVRADAVSLVSRLLEGNPSLERHCLPHILSLTTDPSNGPKKKAINLLKKIHLSSTDKDHKLMIVASLLLPSQDHEKSIADMARQALEEIWLGALSTDARSDEHKLKLRRAERASLLVQIIRRIQGQAAQLDAFEKFFAGALATKSPNSATHFRICKELAVDMVEGVISPDSMASGCSQEHVLKTLSIFARIGPDLFSLDQLQLLKLYVKNPATTEDLDILRPTVTIFRFVLPRLSNLQADFAEEVWKSLSVVIPRLAGYAGRGSAAGKATLLDVIRCSWMISPLFPNGIRKLIQAVSSTLVQLEPLSSCSKEAAVKAQSKIISYLILMGTFGKVCDFDSHAEVFRASVFGMAKRNADEPKHPATQEQLKRLLQLGVTSPSAILLETVRPFSKQPWDLTIREHALCSAGEICQGSTKLFERPDVQTTFKVVFKNDVPSLKRIALTQFQDFFLKAEQRSDQDHQASKGETPADGAGRLGITFQAGDGQVATNWLAREFLPDIVDVALKNSNELAILATNIITSVSRQGLVHPKECGPALIALGTSPNVQIAQNAAIEHKKIHDAHESMFEKEYMAAVRLAFEYQQEVFEDPHGMVAATYKPKMLQVFNVLKGGGRKTLKKFAENLSKEVDFELPKLEDPDAGSKALLFARFCLENIALFDVPKIEDVAIITSALESIVMKHTGPSVGVAIETEIPKKSSPEPQFQQQLQEATGEVIAPPPPPAQDPRVSISDARLLQITRACIILQMMWETRCFIRKAYNLHNIPGRIPHKDFQKPASRNNFVSGKELWERLDSIYNSLDSRETMMKRCHDFAELLEVDEDAQFGGEGEEGDDQAGYATPDEAGNDSSAIPNSGRGRKRKSNVAVGNTPKKARGRPLGAKNKKRNSRTPDLDGWD